MKGFDLSKKTYFILAFFVILFGVIIGAFLVSNSPSTKADIGSYLSQWWQNNEIKVGSPSEDDFDNDGLSDEDEKIRGTDWRLPDTDGDGYLDGEEVDSGYDPLRPAPNDKITESVEPRPLPKNLTLALSSRLSQKTTAGSFEPIVNSLDKVSVMPSQELDQTVSESLGYGVAVVIREYSVQEIPDSEIIISDKDDYEAAKIFSTQIMAAINRAAKKSKGVKQNELNAIIEAIETGNFSDLNEYIKGYEKTYEYARQIPVPKTWKEIHKRHLSILQAHAKILKAVKEIRVDPLKTTLALQQYESVINASHQLMRDGLGLIEKNKTDTQ